MVIRNRNDTRNTRKEGLDKFYTLPEYSKKCISLRLDSVIVVFICKNI